MGDAIGDMVFENRGVVPLNIVVALARSVLENDDDGVVVLCNCEGV